MLPWIFAVLALLNVGLFVWGYQREQSFAPPPPPVPHGTFEIRLAGEPPEPDNPKRSPDALPRNPKDWTAPEGDTASDPRSGQGAASPPGRTDTEQPDLNAPAESGAPASTRQPEKSTAPAFKSGLNNVHREQNTPEPAPEQSTPEAAEIIDDSTGTEPSA